MNTRDDSVGLLGRQLFSSIRSAIFYIRAPVMSRRIVIANYTSGCWKYGKQTPEFIRVANLVGLF